MIVVRAEQGVKVAGWDPNEFCGGGGTVGCPLAEIVMGWGSGSSPINPGKCFGPKHLNLISHPLALGYF